MLERLMPEVGAPELDHAAGERVALHLGDVQNEPLVRENLQDLVRRAARQIQSSGDRCGADGLGLARKKAQDRHTVSQRRHPRTERDVRHCGIPTTSRPLFFFAPDIRPLVDRHCEVLRHAEKTLRRRYVSSHSLPDLLPFSTAARPRPQSLPLGSQGPPLRSPGRRCRGRSCATRMRGRH